jgi:N-acetylneuraminate lyase
MQTPFCGAWPALVTPADTSGGVNVTVLRELVDYLLGKQIDGLYLCGSTGEGVLLSQAERRQVVAVVMDQVAGRIPVIVHVGSVSTRESVALARHSHEVGAVGVSSILPMVNVGVAGIYEHYQQIAEAVPDLPFFPYLFGGQTDALALMRELKQRIPNLHGAKYTGPNMYELGRILDESADGWTIFSGMDEQCLFAMLVGAPGNIGSTLNFMPGLYRDMRARFQDGDLAGAMTLQRRANQVTTVLIQYGFSGALCEMMRLLGFDCGEPRLPHLPLADNRKADLLADLERVDFRQLVDL